MLPSLSRGCFLKTVNIGSVYEGRRRRGRESRHTAVRNNNNNNDLHLFTAEAVWNSLLGWLLSLWTMPPEPPLCKMTKIVVVVLRTRATLWQHHFNSSPAEDSFTEAVPRDQDSKASSSSTSFYFLQFQQYPEQNCHRKHIWKPQTTRGIFSMCFNSLKTVFLSKHVLQE